MELFPQQSKAMELIGNWLRDRAGKQIFRLFGFAGTGKTTIAKEVRNIISGRILFAAFTGKAALVLRSKGCTNASTIHSLIYKAVEETDRAPCVQCKGLKEHPIGTPCQVCRGTGDGPGQIKVGFRLNPESPVRGAALIIIDECSMVDEDLARDLMSFGTPILVLGDPFQLPPVKGTGFFTNAEPDFLLTDIHRQALESPVIRLSMDVREGRGIKVGDYGDSRIIRRPDLQPGEVMAADQVLCGRNNTRRGLNYRFRDQLGYSKKAEDYPCDGDRVVCLRNDRERQLYNGSLWKAARSRVQEVQTLKEGVPVKQRLIHFEVTSEDSATLDVRTDVTVPVEWFLGAEEKLSYSYKRNYDAFDFGYALTVHKSQGSQWNHVMVFDESEAFREHAARHLYTAITRAAERVTVVL